MPTQIDSGAGDTTNTIAGVVPVVPTPFLPTSEDIDEPALRRLIDFAVQTGAAAVCLPAYGSEFYKLTETERLRVVEIAVDHAHGRLPVIAQCNHGSATVAASFAQQSSNAGASVVSFALPRQFPLTDTDLLAYAQTVCNAVQVPVLMQDWNPAGSAIGAEFCSELLTRSPNFRYVKLEEPHMGAKVRAIIHATAGRVGVFEGWGGLYMMELAPTGITGIMPGLALADMFVCVWQHLHDGNAGQASTEFQKLAPWLAFSLSDMEFFNAMEKRLLVARSLLPHDTLRCPTVTIDGDTLNYADTLIHQIIAQSSP